MSYDFVSGMTVALGAVVALLFVRAFARTRDRLFLFFGLAFVVLALERFMLVATASPAFDQPIGYVPRILAFGLIAFAIIERNRR